MLKKKTIRYLTKHKVHDLSGKTIVITGANSGVGFKACEECLFLGADLLMACRNEEKANQAKESLLKEYPDAKITVYPLDLADMESIKRFAARVKRNKVDVYGFVNNAGCINKPKEKTKDGYDLVLGTNYLGTYLLTERMLPYFKTLPHPVKLINTTSITYRIGKIKYDDFFMEKKKYRSMKIYARSKLSVTRYSIYLANQLMDSNVEVTMTHPGASSTPLAKGMVNRGLRKIINPFFGLMQSPEKSALAIPYVLTNDVRPGSLVGPHVFLQMYGFPKLNRIKKKAYSGINDLIRFTKKTVGE